MWPNFQIRGDLRRDGHAFQPGTTWPNLRMVIDPDLSCDDATSRYFDFLRNSDVGTTVLTRVLNDDRPSRIGDYQVVEPATISDEHAVVREMTASGMASRAVFFARNNTTAAFNWAQASGHDPDDARDRQIDVKAAQALQADIYVTDNRFALSRQLNGSVFACSPREAMAIIGLHQRLQGRLEIDSEPFPQSLDLAWAEYVQSWGLLPNTLSLFALAVPPSMDHTKWRDLARVASVRFERCLRARDQILAQSIHPNLTFPFASEDALVELIALNLSGMFDALARAINAATSLGVDDRHCSFASRDFRRRLPVPVRHLTSLPKNGALLGAIGTLRNTIHHIALSQGARHDSPGGGVGENFVILPTSDAGSFLQDARTLGAAERWTSLNIEDLGLILNPLPLIEDLITQTVLLFERIVSAMDWPGTIAEELRMKSDDPGEYWMHFAPTVLRVSALYGLELVERSTASPEVI
jgi:hypothetical protein